MIKKMRLNKNTNSKRWKKILFRFFYYLCTNKGYFNIINKLLLTEHKTLSFEFYEDKNIKLEKMKEIIEPYTIA